MQGSMNDGGKCWTSLNGGFILSHQNYDFACAFVHAFLVLLFMSTAHVCGCTVARNNDGCFGQTSHQSQGDCRLTPVTIISSIWIFFSFLATRLESTLLSLPACRSLDHLGLRMILLGNWTRKRSRCKSTGACIWKMSTLLCALPYAIYS